MFLLCRKCAEEMDHSADSTDTEEQRALSGTWVIEEVVKAPEMGYTMIEIQEVWRYKTVSCDPA